MTFITRGFVPGADRANRQAFSYKTCKVVGQVLGTPLSTVCDVAEENSHAV